MDASVLPMASGTDTALYLGRSVPEEQGNGGRAEGCEPSPTEGLCKGLGPGVRGSLLVKDQTENGAQMPSSRRMGMPGTPHEGVGRAEEPNPVAWGAVRWNLIGGAPGASMAGAAGATEESHPLPGMLPERGGPPGSSVPQSPPGL